MRGKDKMGVHPVFCRWKKKIYIYIIRRNICHEIEIKCTRTFN